MKVEVRPIDRKTWHGKVGQESFKRPIKLKALVDAASMEYASGLDKDEAVKYGEVLRQDLTPNYNPDEPHAFWDSSMATINLENRTMFFDQDKTLDFIKVRIMKASKYVANSLAEYDKGLWPDATHVIFDETEEVAVTAGKVEVKKQAVIQSSELSKDKKIEMILILTGKNLKGKSDGFVEVELDKLIQGDPREILRHIKMDAEDRTIHAIILEAIQKSVLRKVGHKVLYHDHVLGGDEIDVIAYLKDPENQDLKLRLMAAINN
tara:strand:- start:2798 stop:3589 length:792 start_codon:yes stop_codon:yes gene_type:complete